GKIDAMGTAAWAGLLFAPGALPMRPANLSSKKAISFFAKGDGKPARLLLFARRLGRIPSAKSFTPGPEWKQYRFSLSAFHTIDGRDLAGLLWTGGPATGPFSFVVDDLKLE